MLKADSKLDRNSMGIEITMLEVRSQRHHVLYLLKNQTMSFYLLILLMINYIGLLRGIIYICIYTHASIHTYI